MRFVGLIFAVSMLVTGCGGEKEDLYAGDCDGAAEGPEGSWTCTDQLDNDGDGRVDCADEGCDRHPACGGECEGSEERDSNPGGDNDVEAPSLGLIQVAVYPTHPSPDDALECRVEIEPWSEVDTGVDAGTTLPTFAFSWYYKTGSGAADLWPDTNPTLSGDVTVDGEDWFCEVGISLNGEESDLIQSEPVSVRENHPPDPPELEIQVQPNGDLICVITEASVDVDAAEEGSSVRYSYAWQVNGIEQPAHVGPLVGAEDTVDTVNQTWKCLVTPSDGQSSGAPGIVEYQVPEGGCAAATYEDREYRFCSTPRDQVDAQTACEVFGMDLVSIMSEAENSWILEEAQLAYAAYGAFFQNYWIGLKPDGGSWIRSGGLESTYLEWASQQPGASSCGVVAGVTGSESGLWSTVSCTELHGYVCEARSYVTDTGDVSLSGGQPGAGDSMIHHGWHALYPNVSADLVYQDSHSKEGQLGFKTHQADGQRVGVKLSGASIDTSVPYLSMEVWARATRQDSGVSLRAMGETGTGAPVEVKLETDADGTFSCAVGSANPQSLSTVSFEVNSWYLLHIDIASDSTVSCHVQRGQGNQSGSTSLPSSENTTYHTIVLESVPSPNLNSSNFTYWDEFRFGY